MKIERFELYPVRVPLKRRITWARSAQDAMEHVYLRMVTDDGITGIGEGLAYVPWSGETLKSIVASLQDIFEPLLVGKNPHSYRDIWAAMDTIAGHHTAKAMVEMAVFDICGKAAGQPCWRWLGGVSGEAPLSWIVTRQDVATMVNDAVTAVERFGFPCLKVKVGRDPVKDIDVIRQIRAELGDGVKVYVDGNGGYSLAQTHRVSAALAEFNVLYMEDPCRVDSVEQFRLFSAGLTVPMLLDRPCRDVSSIATYMANGAAAMGIKLGHLGYRHTSLVAEMGRHFGTSVCVGYHGESHVGCIAAAHFAAGVLGGSELPCEASFFVEIAEELSDPPLVFKEGHLQLSERPGFGVELNEGLLTRFAV